MTQQAQLHRILKGVFTVEKCSVFKFCHLNSLRIFFIYFSSAAINVNVHLCSLFPKLYHLAEKAVQKLPQLLKIKFFKPPHFENIVAL